MKIRIQNLQKSIRINPARILRTARKVLKHCKALEGELSLAIVSDARIRTLNRNFLKHDFATDVITFDLRPVPRGRVMQGEIVISADTARRNARLFNTSLQQELDLYVVHGILHLLGYDDHSPADIRRMRAAESKCMKVLKP